MFVPTKPAETAPRTVRLRRRLDEVLGAGHPWVYRDALAGAAGLPGAVVTLAGRDGRPIAHGIADGGPIGVRIWTTQNRAIDASLFRERIERAARLRDLVVPSETTAYRLLHGEGDRTPGFVCDVYGDTAVLQTDGAGAAAWSSFFVECLSPVLCARGTRSLLAKEGRQDERRVRAVFGEVPRTPRVVREHGMILEADVVHGQKTGLFLDHRESRRRVRELSGGRDVLNLFGYTGGFSVAAGLGGAIRVTTVDVAKPAIASSTRNWAHNGLAPDRHRGVAEDAMAFLVGAAKRRAFYDLIVCDPPSFAPNERAVPKATKAYAALHAAALGRVRPDGLYVAASCSSHVRLELFERTLAEGARRANRIVQILETSGTPPDHPRLAAFPEGDYLKVLLCRVSPRG